MALARSIHGPSSRDQALSSVPELAKHVWQDDYFDQSQVEIVSVFDHDQERFARAKRIKLVTIAIIVFAIFALSGLLCIIDWKVGVRLLLYLSGVFGVILSMTILTCHTASPHTAIAVDGVIHIDQERRVFFFPFSDIDEMRDSVMILSKEFTCYQECSWVKCCSRALNCHKFKISYLKDPQLFHETVVRLKEAECKGTMHDEETAVSRDQNSVGTV